MYMCSVCCFSVSSSSEPIQTRNVVSTASSLPPMIAPPSVVSSRVGPPMYTGGMPYHSPTGPPRDEYVPANLQTQTVPSVSPYNHHPYMAEGKSGAGEIEKCEIVNCKCMNKRLMLFFAKLSVSPICGQLICF